MLRSLAEVRPFTPRPVPAVFFARHLHLPRERERERECTHYDEPHLNPMLGAFFHVLAVAAALWPLWSAVRRLLGGLVNLPALASRTELGADLAYHLSTAEGVSATWQLPLATAAGAPPQSCGAAPERRRQ